MEERQKKSGARFWKVLHTVLIVLAGLAVVLGILTLVLAFLGGKKAVILKTNLYWKKADAGHFMSLLVSESRLEELKNESDETDSPTPANQDIQAGELLEAIMRSGSWKMTETETGGRAEFTVPDLYSYLEDYDFEEEGGWGDLYEDLVNAVEEGELPSVTHKAKLRFVKVDGQTVILATNELMDMLYGGLISFRNEAAQQYIDTWEEVMKEAIGS